MKNYIIALALLTGCWPHQSSLEDVSEDVIQHDRGVIIDVEPGQKK